LAAAGRLVLDDELGAEPFDKPFGEQAKRNIRHRARRKRRDNADRARGKFVL
jgi:hypothetical protein